MKGSKTVVCILLVAFLGWQSNLVNSAIIVQNPSAVPPALHNTDDPNNPNITVRLFQEALSEYAELTNAYYAPAQDESVREKRTINVIRNLANRTRSGFASLRMLFGGSSSSSGSGFRTFFSNLLNRILIFLTNLWDRITGFFRRDGSQGGGASGGVLGRLGGLFRGGAGGGGLLSIFRPPTTTESYFSDSDFSFYSSSSTTESPKDNDLGLGLEEAVGSNSISETKGKSVDDKGTDDESDLIPFPGDLSSRTGKDLDKATAVSSPVALAVKSDDGKQTSPHVVSSPSIIHLIDDGRRFA